jgi:hypothetical protein
LVTVNIGPKVCLAIPGGIVCPTLKQNLIKNSVQTIQHTIRLLINLFEADFWLQLRWSCPAFWASQVPLIRASLLLVLVVKFFSFFFFFNA